MSNVKNGPEPLEYPEMVLGGTFFVLDCPKA